MNQIAMSLLLQRHIYIAIWTFCDSETQRFAISFRDISAIFFQMRGFQRGILLGGNLSNWGCVCTSCNIVNLVFFGRELLVESYVNSEQNYSMWPVCTRPPPNIEISQTRSSKPTLRQTFAKPSPTCQPCANPLPTPLPTLSSSSLGGLKAPV